LVVKTHQEKTITEDIDEGDMQFGCSIGSKVEDHVANLGAAAKQAFAVMLDLYQHHAQVADVMEDLFRELSNTHQVEFESTRCEGSSGVWVIVSIAQIN
jgi:hypothetical protein